MHENNKHHTVCIFLEGENFHVYLAFSLNSHKYMYEKKICRKFVKAGL